MANPEHVDFFVGLTTDAKTYPIRVSIQDVALFVDGVFDGATVKIEVSPDAIAEDPETMTWFDHPNGTFTDATQDVKKFWNNADLSEVAIRASLENAGAQTSIDFKMRPRVEKTI